MPSKTFTRIAWTGCLAAWGLLWVVPAQAQSFALHSVPDRPVPARYDVQPPDGSPSPATPAPQEPPAVDRPTVTMPVDEEEYLLPGQTDGWGYDPLEGVAVPYVINPWISVTGQLAWLHRSEGDRSAALVNAATATTNTTVLSTEHLNFPTEAGFRGSVLLGPAEGRYVELSYLGVFDQQASGSVDVNPTNLVSTTRSFLNVNTVSLTNRAYSAAIDSSLHSPELNVWLNDNRWRFRPMFGARWFQQSEEFNLYETATPSLRDSLSLTNNLVGAQVGFHSVLWQRTDWFGVQAVCKAGVYRNSIDFSAAQYAGAPLLTMDRSFTTTSCSGSVDITAIWQLTPHLNFHFGYTGLWLTEVASASDQMDNFNLATGTGTIDVGGISYQGGHLGVTFAW